MQYANDVDVFGMGKVKHRIGEMVHSPEPQRRLHISQGVTHGAGGRMPFDVMERLGNSISKPFCDLQVCNIKVVLKRKLQVVGRLGK